MPTVKLTEAAVRKLKSPDPSGKQVLHWDAELKGFGVLCSGTTNSKTFIAQRALPGGKSRRVTVGSTAEMPLKDARDRAAQVLLDMRNGIDPKAGRRGAATLREALDQYITARSSLKPRSKTAYRDVVLRHLQPWLDWPIRDIGPDDVEARHRAIKEEVEAAGHHSGNSTANAAMVALRTLWNYCADRDPTMPQNPVRRLKRAWFAVHRRERHVHAEDLPKFYQAVIDLPSAVARDYLLLLLFTGLRRREAAGLQWKDIDLPNRVIRLSAATTKSGKKLDLPMSDYVHDLLVARRSLGDAKYVFPSNSKSGHIEEPKFPLRQVAKACGVEISAHDLRRTFVTVAESSDISPTALAALVNHSVGRSVTAGYVQMATDRLRDPAQRVADRMKSLCGIVQPNVTRIAAR